MGSSPTTYRIAPTTPEQRGRATLHTEEACPLASGPLTSRAALTITLASLLTSLPAALLLLSAANSSWVLALMVALQLAVMLVAAVSLSSVRLRAMRASLENDALVTRLQRQIERAVDENSSKSRFLAAASHDLRQPVHALSLFAGALERRVVGTEDEPLVRNVNECVSSLSASLKALLDISRLDARVVQPTPQTFMLRDVFKRLHLHFGKQAECQGLQLRFRPGGRQVTTDPQMLERILGNLIQNALKNTCQGGVAVVARSTSKSLNIEVWDTGVGIPPHQLAAIFEEYYQLDNPTHDRSHGLGMGLAIVKRLVLLLGHTLQVWSRPGRGTMFRLRIPRHDSPALQDIGLESDTVPSPMGETGTVLVIDDEPNIRESMALLLTQWGYDTLVAGSLREARRVASEYADEIQTVLADLRLNNGEDGLEAIEAVERTVGRRLTAVLVTGETSAAQIQRVHDSDRRVLFKPVTPKELHAVLRGL